MPSSTHSLSDRGIRERITYLSRYMRNINPRVSIYAKLKEEKTELEAEQRRRERAIPTG